METENNSLKNIETNEISANTTTNESDKRRKV